MKLYPLFADLTHRAVLVVGGGAVAERNVAALLRAQAQVTVNALELTPQLKHWVTQGHITYRSDAFQDSWLDRVWLVVAATSNRELNLQIAAFAGLRRIFVNVVDDAALSSFHARAVVDRAPLDWVALSQEQQTLEVYIGLGEPDVLQTQLIQHGRAASTPYREWLARRAARGHWQAGTGD